MKTATVTENKPGQDIYCELRTRLSWQAALMVMFKSPFVTDEQYEEAIIASEEERGVDADGMPLAAVSKTMTIDEARAIIWAPPGTYSEWTIIEARKALSNLHANLADPAEKRKFEKS